AAAYCVGSQGFVREHQPPRIEAFHFGLPGRTSLLDVGPLLLRGMKDFFLNVSCKARSARAMVGMLHSRPKSCRSSASVASGFSSTSFRKRSACGSHFGCLREHRTTGGD